MRVRLQQPMAAGWSRPGLRVQYTAGPLEVETKAEDMQIEQRVTGKIRSADKQCSAALCAASEWQSAADGLGGRVGAGARAGLWIGGWRQATAAVGACTSIVGQQIGDTRGVSRFWY